MSRVLQLEAKDAIAFNSVWHVAVQDFDRDLLDCLLVLEGQHVLNMFVVDPSMSTGPL